MISLLKQRGFTEEQARGIKEALESLDLQQLTTKADLRELELRLTIKMGGMLVVGVTLVAAIVKLL